MATATTLLLGLTALSGLYWLAALAAALAFSRRAGARRPAAASFTPSVSVLKPLAGDDGQLYDNLRSFCLQDYPRFEVLFGVRDPDDPALPVVRRLLREFPGRDLGLVVSERAIGSNPKVSNLANLWLRARHEVVVVADGDVRVGADYLASVVAPLEDRTVGLVTCLYRALAAGGRASRLGAMFINEWFFPSAALAARLERLRYAFGATMACRRSTLAALGGFGPLADHLADDYLLGRLVARQGLRVVLAPRLVDTVVVERDLPGLLLHELRWARTIRAVRPASYFLAFVTHGLPLAALAVAVSGASAPALGLLALHLGLRCGGRALLRRALGLPAVWRDTALVPLRDALSVGLWALSFLGQRVRWNGRTFRIGRGGTLRPAAPSDAPPPARDRRAAAAAAGAPIAPRPSRGYLRTLFLHPPSWKGFDGGAGARYQARREIRSFWYPTWLAQPAALVPGSRLVDAPPAGLTLDDVRPLARSYDLVVIHTSTPSFRHDVAVAEALKAEHPGLRIGFVGPHVVIDPARALAASEAIEFVARREYDFTIQEIAEGRPLGTVLGVTYRDDGRIAETPDRPPLEAMDALPWVVDVYKRDLVIEHYAIGYLLHPYVSLYTGRGCRFRCTFCLWPQTVGGRRYRTRSVEHVVGEIAQAIRYFPQVKEYFFDDDTFTADPARAEAIARGLGPLGVTWSCTARANVPYDTLKVLRDHGLRLLLVGYESGNQAILNNVRKGLRLDIARRFTRHARALGIRIHGTFVLGLPGETRETIEETIRYATELDPDTIQVSIAAPYPGTELYRQALEHGWLAEGALVDARGIQVSSLSYPHLSSAEILRAVQDFYRRFYFRPRKLFALAREMLTDRHLARRRLAEGAEFVQFLARR